MNTKDNFVSDTSYKKLLNNDNYFKHIFKKTEKIISVVFYILKNTDVDKKSETQFSNIASKAHFAHENALRTLEVKLASGREVLEQFAQSLVGLDSTLRVAAASGILAPEVLAVMVGEIDTVLRGLRTYIQTNTSVEQLFSFVPPHQTVGSFDAAPTPMRTPKVRKEAVSASGAAPAPSDDRRTRIKTILEAKKEATIKDISEIISDVSEKTIQRELNAMIDENIVKRQGERRWSKYSLF
jgi:DNA-binding transcriptional ArsR family regulator